MAIQDKVYTGDGKPEIKDNARLFTQETGQPIHPDSLTKWISKFRKRHGLPDFSPHTLRHTNISLMIAAGIDLRTISRRSGHAKLSTTTDIYAHAIKTADEKAAQVIGSVITIK